MKAYIIPGFGYRAFEAYGRVREQLTAAGFCIRALDPDWQSKDFGGMLRFIHDSLEEDAAPGSIVIGHSIGGNLGLHAMKLRPEHGYVFASKSFVCAEGYGHERSAKVIEEVLPGQRETISSLSITATAQEVQIDPRRIAILCGDDEGEAIHRIADITGASFGVDPIKLPAVEHMIEEHPTYIAAVVEAAMRVSEAAARQA